MLAIDAPPGPGWQWFDGENDGKLHGPVRVGEIRVESGGRRDKVTLELLSIEADVDADASRQVVMTAGTPAPDADPVFRVKLQSLLPKPVAGKLRCRFVTWEGETVGQSELEATAPSVVDIPAPRLPAGSRFLEAVIEYDVPGQSVPGVRPCWVKRPQPSEDTRLKPDSIFGMGVYLDRHTDADLARVARAAREAGVKWTREDLQWREIEPKQGEMRWELFDRRVAVARREGISIYAIVSGFPDWVEPYTPAALDGYCRFLEAAVARYKGDVHHWEIWNEPNIFFWQGPKEMYNTLLTKAYHAVKEADPAAKVLGMSTAGIDYNFIARSMARGTPFDELTIHPYRTLLDDGELLEELRIVSDLVGKRRVWITEFGWAVHTPHNAIEQDFAPNSRRAQAEYLARAYLCAFASGAAPNTSWYNFRDDGDDPMYFESNMGIMTLDLRPKPAYAAYATMTRLLEDRKMTERLATAPSVFALRFTPGNVVAAWSPRAEADFEMAVAGPVQVVNTIGESRDVSPVDGKVKLRLRKSAPVYIVPR